MKKYFFMAVAVLASLTACQPEPEQVIVNDGTIKFMSAPVTRAETDFTDLSDFTNNGTSFAVYGYTKTGETKETLFDGVLPTHSRESEVDVWNTTETKYWADAVHYNFYAFYKATSVTASYDKAEVVLTSPNADQDFVAASNCEILGNVFNAPVQLTFKHQLSRVAINFVNKFNDPNMKITVSNVVVHAVPVSAKFTYNATSNTSHNPTVVDDITPVITVTDADKKDVAFEFASTNEIQGVTETATTYNDEVTVYKYFVPTTAAVAYKMSCTVKFETTTSTGATTLSVTKDYTNLDLNSIQYLAGQGYIFTANVYDTVNPIKFNVSVVDWHDNTVDGSIEIGNR